MAVPSLAAVQAAIAQTQQSGGFWLENSADVSFAVILLLVVLVSAGGLLVATVCWPVNKVRSLLACTTAIVLAGPTWTSLYQPAEGQAVEVLMTADAFLLDRPVNASPSVIRVLEARSRLQQTIHESERMQRRMEFMQGSAVAEAPSLERMRQLVALR